MYLVLLILLSIAFIILAGTRLRWHPILSLLVAALGFGVLSGMPVADVIATINQGFGSTIGNIGLLIILGIIIGTFLEKSGGAAVLARRVLQIIGANRVHTALGLVGYIVSIPVYADSGFIILHPLARAMAKKAGAPVAGACIALGLGLTASHTMVPPTPGPIAAAGIMGADLGLVVGFGLLTSAIALMACILYARWVGPRLVIRPELATDHGVSAAPQDPPGAFKALLPILIPIVLILLNSVSRMPFHPFGEGALSRALEVAGTPVAALGIGLLFALTLPAKFEKRMLDTTGWVGEALSAAAIIILITGAGGAFGKVLQQAGIGDLIGTQVQSASLGLWLPFLTAAAIKSAQGSSTVALITTASIIAPLQASLGFDAPATQALAVVAIGAGSAVVSHANDSFFWVVTQLIGLDTKQGYLGHTAGTAILGFTAMTVLSLLSFFLN
ncbi:GntP family permease [Robiginitalea sp. SC105]|uniref:GntP family permease n=1 Tax=Robiginitalea sp. SC105 TaxID=2762332 RepID=UPI00163A1AE0|nr:GntP family permease [Robiginitalea sp. SC105]MBC2838706.1 GntP family permease [Robiginitalea sp. SC105]